MSIKDSARKTLWTRARNQCAFPGCLQALTLDAPDARTGVTDVVLLGEEAHIRARSEGGPRYDPEFTDVNGYENLVLMCPTHHAMIDANGGVGYTVEALITMKATHERNQDRREGLVATLRAYLGDRYAAENTVQFQQVDLRGPSVDAMFVDVPVGVRRDGSALAGLLTRISEAAPGDTGDLERASDLVITGATQALLHPEWVGNAVLVGGPGQGKSTLLQYVCQFHRARRLGESGYTAGEPELVRARTTVRFPVRIDLRKYAQWALKPSLPTPYKQRKKVKHASEEADTWRSLEEYVIDDIRRHIGAHEFGPRDLVLLLATEPVLLALDGLDEVASLAARARVVAEIVHMRGRLSADAADLVILLATRPGTSLQPLTSSGVFPVLHLQRLTQGLRLQYLRQWCEVSRLGPEAEERLQSTFMDSQHVPHISELASYPMQLAILLHLLYRRQLLPQQRTELYEEYLKTFLDREQTEDKEPLLADKRRVVEETHAYLGWYLQTKAEEGRSAGSITRIELREQLRIYLAGRPKEQQLADQLYSAMTDRVLCLVERDDAFEFEVQSLREYFASIHIFENLTPKGDGNSRDDGLNALLERPYWANVCRFFIGQLARGEVRGLISNLRTVDRRVAPHPLVRAMAVTVLNDRIYDSLTSAEIREVVDFIFEGAGVVLAEDGWLDPAGIPLRLAEEAGRVQAVSHLKSRLAENLSSSLREIIVQSLAAHATPDDGLAEWWWTMFEPTASWLGVAARLEAFVNLTLERSAQLTMALATADLDTWPSDILISGRYNGHDDAILQLVTEALNAGAAETEHRTAATDVEVLAACASNLLAGVDTTTSRTSTIRPSGRQAKADARVQEAARTLGSDASLSSIPGWDQYLSAVADAWGDGWVLRRAVSMIPVSIDLESLAARSHSSLVTAAVQIEADYRANKSNVDWWIDYFAAASEHDRVLGVLGLLEYAKSAVIVQLAPVLEGVVNGFDKKHFRMLERALHRDVTSRKIRSLDLHDALRLRRINLPGRLLWLVWIIATDATRESISSQLEVSLQDVFIAGTAYGAAAVAAARTARKMKLDTFDGARVALPSIGSTFEVQLSSMTLKMAESILREPAEWPADLVQLAIDKIGTRAATRTSPLADLAARNHWFRS